MLIPAGITIGFGVIASMRLLAIMVTIDILKRSGDYAIMKHAREMLYTILSREENTKLKISLIPLFFGTVMQQALWLIMDSKRLEYTQQRLPA